MEERVKPRALLLFWIRLIAFAVIFAVLAHVALEALTPDYDYGTQSLVNLREQPRDSVDVLCLGTSLIYSGINTNVLWHDYGIAAYDLCSAELQYWNAYYLLKEALRRQTPKVVLLDAKPASYGNDYTERGRIVLNTYALRSPADRWEATRLSVKREEDFLGHIWKFPNVHSNYADLFSSSREHVSNWKGYIETDATEKHERPSLVWNNIEKPVEEKELEGFHKIAQLCAEEGIPLVVIAVPNPDYAYDHMYCNTLKRHAEEEGVIFINFNDPSLRFGLRYSSDFADWQHLNIKGSITFSRALGQMLSESGVPDRRGDSYYDSYEECYRFWIERWEDYREMVEGA